MLTTLDQPDISFFEGILNHVKDPVFVKDERHKFVLLNDASCAFFGLDRDAILGKTDFDIFPENEASIYRRIDIEVLNSGEANVNVESFTDSFGNKFIISTKKSCYKTENGENYLVAIIRDISELKKTERLLLDSIDKLAEFAYTASHDLKVPMNTIKFLVDLIEKDTNSSLSDKSKSYLNYIKSASVTADDLISGLLEYATVDRDYCELDLVDLNETIKEVETNMFASILSTNATLKCDKLPIIKANNVRVYQLFQNLISNAIKFRKETRDPIIYITYEEKDSNHVISIEDNGIGINELDSDTIFKMFVKLNSSDEYSGSGIGLTISKKILENLGGTIKVESILGLGSKFIIKLPI